MASVMTTFGKVGKLWWVPSSCFNPLKARLLLQGKALPFEAMNVVFWVPICSNSSPKV